METRSGSAARPYGQAIMIMAAVLAAAVVVAVVWPSDRDDAGSAAVTDTNPETTTETTTASTTMTGDATPPATGGSGAVPLGEPIESRLPWPVPPADHEPHVLTSPGDGPLVDDADGLAVVYVNSIGRATFLDLASGDRSEIQVSPERVVDRIALEASGFRSLVQRQNVRLAGTEAIVVFLHQPTLLAGWSGEDEPGLHLCLTDVCAARPDHDRLVLDRQRVGDVEMTVQHLDDAGRPDVAALVEGAVPTSGRFRVVDTPHGSARVPAPGAGPIWLIVAGDPGRTAEV